MDVDAMEVPVNQSKAPDPQSDWHTLENSSDCFQDHDEYDSYHEEEEEEEEEEANESRSSKTTFCAGVVFKYSCCSLIIQ